MNANTPGPLAEVIQVGWGPSVAQALALTLDQDSWSFLSKKMHEVFHLVKKGISDLSRYERAAHI